MVKGGEEMEQKVEQSQSRLTEWNEWGTKGWNEPNFFFWKVSEYLTIIWKIPITKITSRRWTLNFTLIFAFLEEALCGQALRALILYPFFIFFHIYFTPFIKNLS